MDSFGERLKSEREGRGLSLQAVAEMLGVDHDRLQALERNDFEALPGDAEMTDCIRAYAGCLEVDADLMLEDYVRERERCVQQLARDVPAAVPVDAGRPTRFPLRLAAAVILGAGAILGGWWMLSGDPVAVTPPAETRQPVSSENQAGFSLTPPEQAAQRLAPTAPRSPALSIPEYGVGTGVENRELVGGGDRFSVGTQVRFWTHVQGGKAGDTIDHVWLHDGVQTARIPLKIGGARWRTYSAKTLRPGSDGEWAVEARDASRRVLARSEFVCVP